MSSISPNPFASTAFPDDFRDFMDFASPFDPLTEADIVALCEMEAERNRDILHEVSLRLPRVTIPFHPVALVA